MIVNKYFIQFLDSLISLEKKVEEEVKNIEKNHKEIKNIEILDSLKKACTSHQKKLLEIKGMIK